MFKKYTKGFLEKEVNAFSRDPNDDNTPLFSEKYLPEVNIEETSSEHDPETVIGEQVTIKGELCFTTLLRIDGNFEGTLVSQGKLIVGPNGSVKANIDLEEAYISGKVEGDITVKERLHLRGRAEVHGNITAKLLSVDEGVSIYGQVNVAPGSPDQLIQNEIP
jgi:cytoskeletal protein CcmA (bactofilin family)